MNCTNNKQTIYNRLQILTRILFRRLINALISDKPHNKCLQRDCHTRLAEITNSKQQTIKKKGSCNKNIWKNDLKCGCKEIFNTNAYNTHSCDISTYNNIQKIKRP